MFKMKELPPPPFNEEQFRMMNELHESFKKYYVSLGRPIQDGECEMSAILLAAYVAGQKCPGFESPAAAQNVINIMASSTVQSFVTGLETKTNVN